MRRKWVVILVTLLTVLTVLLSACGPTQEPNVIEETKTEEPAEEPTEAPIEENEWTAIQGAGKLVVGTSADYPPFEFINENDEFDGFDMALIREVGNRLGIEIEIQDIAFDGLIAALKAGQIDAIIAAMSATPE
ncbi:MAG: transporter substrate-binding domain-containing protein, partial [Anaerolineae bacterium]|nr:transporter substrate-binding domain-containing protein [Anaerolineae bacterium]